jgi:hypothetical protein
MAVEFGGCVGAAELEFDGAGTVGERAGVREVLGGLGGIVGKHQLPGLIAYAQNDA